MKKKLLPILLTLCLLLALLTTAALAGQTVTEVWATVNIPKAGASPEAPKLYKGSGDLVRISLYEWKDVETGARIYDYDTFEAGKTYRLLVQVFTLSGNTVTSDTVGYINGLKAKTLNQGDGYFTFYHDWFVEGPPITSVELQVTAPAAGEAPVFSANENDPRFHVMTNVNDTRYTNGVNWYCVEDDENLKINGKDFEAEKTYRVIVALRAEKGYRFATDDKGDFTVTVTVNGALSSDKITSYYYDDEAVYVRYTFPALPKPAVTPVTSAAFTAEAPALGSTPGSVSLASATGAKLYYAEWREYDSGKSPVKALGGAETFQAGTRYGVEVTLSPEVGYTLSDLTAENVTLNGQPAELLRRTGSDVTAVFFFPPLKTPIETVKVTITPPASGEYPAQFFTADEGACSQDITVNSGDFWSGIAWYDTTGGSAVPMALSDKFQAGHTYTVKLVLAPTEGYLFSLSPTVSVDGIPGEVTAVTEDQLQIGVQFTQELTRTLSVIMVTFPPDKTDYTEDDPFDPTGMIVKAYYTDGTEDTVTNYTLSPASVSLGDTCVTVTYTEGDVTATAEQPITVHAKERKLLSISVTTYPDKMQYKPGEYFDPMGMAVTAYYDDGSSEVVSGCTWTPDGALGENDPTVTVSYTEGDITVTADLPILTRIVWSIAVTELPQNTEYKAGNVFDPAGMVVTAYYSDETSEPVTGYTWTPDGTLGENDTTVTISYTEGGYTRTTELNITVKPAEKVLKSIAITTEPDKTTYKAGEYFASGGMVVTATYDDDSSEPVTGYLVSPAKLTADDCMVTISYTEGEVTATAEQAVTVKAEDKENPFADVSSVDYYYDAVLCAYHAKPQVTNGMDTTHFGPERTVTRGQTVTFLWRAMGCPEPASSHNPFTDVKESDYFYKAVLWALEKGITKGTSDTLFSPAQTCSTAHIITFLYRTMGIGADGWYAVAEAWAKGAGLLDGLSITVMPGVDCPRCDVVLYLYRALT